MKRIVYTTCILFSLGLLALSYQNFSIPNLDDHFINKYYPNENEQKVIVPKFADLSGLDKVNLSLPDLEKSIQALCKNEDDNETCNTENKNAYSKMKFTVDSNASTSWLRISYPICKKESLSNKIVNIAEMQSCLENEISSLDSIEKQRASNASQSGLAEACFNKWHKDGGFRKIKTCLNNPSNSLTNNYETRTEFMGWILDSSKTRDLASITSLLNRKLPFYGDPETIGQIKVAEKRIGTLAQSLIYSYSLKGRIIDSKSRSEFPDLINDIVSFGYAPMQILHVDVGQPAILIMTDNLYETTGRFSIDAKKFTTIDTSLGSTPVYIQYSDLKNDKAEYANLEKKIINLVPKNFSNSVKKYQDHAVSLQKSLKTIYPSDIAGLLHIISLGKQSGDDSSMYNYQLTSNGMLCHLANKYALNSKSWKDKLQTLTSELTKQYPGTFTESDSNLLKNIMCGDGGPFKHKDTSLTFSQCMCGNHKGSLVTNIPRDFGNHFKESLTKHYASIDASVNKQSIKDNILSDAIMFDKSQVKFESGQYAWLEIPIVEGKYKKSEKNYCEQMGLKFSLGEYFGLTSNYQYDLRSVCAGYVDFSPSKLILDNLKAKKAEYIKKSKLPLPPKEKEEVVSALKDWDEYTSEQIVKSAGNICPGESSPVSAKKTSGNKYQIKCRTEQSLAYADLCQNGEWDTGSNECKKFVCPDGKTNISNFDDDWKEGCFSCPAGSEFDMEQSIGSIGEPTSYTVYGIKVKTQTKGKGALCRILSGQIKRDSPGKSKAKIAKSN